MGHTDWARLRAMSEEEIERMAAEDQDNPATDDEHWRQARVGLPPTTLTEDQATKLRALDGAIARGIADADAGRVKPIEEVAARLTRKYEAMEDAERLNVIRARIRQEGLDSGPAEPLDMQEIKAAARAGRAKGNKAAARG